MADATGISQPTWSRVIAGRQAPSWKLLVALIEQGVNIEWVLTERGEPFLRDTPEHRSGDPIFLVAKSILPGPPEDHRDHLIGMDLHVDNLTRSNSRYWLQVQPGDPVVRASDEDIRLGDLILLETNPDHWKDDLWRLNDQIGAFRLNTGRAHLLVLGRIRAELLDCDQPCKLSAHVFGLGVMPVVLPDTEVRTYGKELRAIDIRKTRAAGAGAQQEKGDVAPNKDAVAELVAVKIYLWRP